MVTRGAVAGIVIAVLLSGCLAETPPDQPTPSQTSPSPSRAAPSVTPAAIDYVEYVEVAVDAMEAYHWNSENIDWQEVRAASVGSLSADPTQAEAHAKLANAVRLFDRQHSVFIPPGDVPAGEEPPIAVPVGERIDNVGYLHLPPVGGGDPDDLRAYVRAAQQAMASADQPEPACGWVVDLRDNTGGNMGPMLHAVAGLLGTGRILTVHNPAGDSWIEAPHDGDLTSGGVPHGVDLPDSSLIELSEWTDEQALAIEGVYESEPPHLPRTDDPPVAVLTSNRTASAAEVVTIAFIGRPQSRVIGGYTLGVPTGVFGFRMADGAVLRLAVSTFSDRQGNEYTGSLVPDDVVADRRADHADAILDAAVGWLMETPACA